MPGTLGRCEAIAVAGSSGAVNVILDLLQALPADFRIPVLVCLHLHPSDEGQLAQHLGERCALVVEAACDKMPVLPGRVHVAPADYHLLVERSRTLALSIDPKVRYCRPSIDVLFESAARVYATGLLGILLSGANEDGAAGMAAIRARGGLTVAQDPASADDPVMPRSAIDCGAATLFLPPDRIRGLLLRLHADPALDTAVREFGDAHV